MPLLPGLNVEDHSLQLHGEPAFAPPNDFAAYLKPSIGAGLGTESALAIQRWNLAGEVRVQLGLEGGAVVRMNDVLKKTVAFAAICSRVSEGSKPPVPEVQPRRGENPTAVAFGSRFQDCLRPFRSPEDSLPARGDNNPSAVRDAQRVFGSFVAHRVWPVLAGANLGAWETKQVVSSTHGEPVAEGGSRHQLCRLGDL